MTSILKGELPSRDNIESSLIRNVNAIVLCFLSLAVLYNAGHRPDSLRMASILAKNGPYYYKLNHFYAPSRIEQYALEHAVELGLTQTMPMPEGCKMWTDHSRTIYPRLMTYLKEMKYYNSLLKLYPGAPTADLRTQIEDDSSICQSVQVHPLGMGGVFPSGSLSRSPGGLLEPVYPPLHDAEFCLGRAQQSSTDYMVHDFSTMCRHLKSNSRIVMINLMRESPASTESSRKLTNLYQKFGFPIDIVYDFTTSPETPSAFTNIMAPDTRIETVALQSASQEDHNNINSSKWMRLREILEGLREDDLVLLQVDELEPDHPKSISQLSPDTPPALLQFVRQYPHLVRILDAVYWKHPIQIAEVEQEERTSRFGRLGSRTRTPPVISEEQRSKRTVADVLQSFNALRRSGVTVHFWI